MLVIELSHALAAKGSHVAPVLMHNARTLFWGSSVLGSLAFLMALGQHPSYEYHPLGEAACTITDVI